MEVVDMFRDEDTARLWIESACWPQGLHCPYCGSFNVQSGIKHKTMTHRCRDCEGKPMFTLRTGSVMEGSKLKFRAWAVGIYLFSVNIKGVSSMHLHRELGIGQKAAWFMLHRLWLAFKEEPGQFVGPVEADETHMGGKRKELTGRGAVDMTTVAGRTGRRTRCGRKSWKGPTPIRYRASSKRRLHREQRSTRMSTGPIAGFEHESVNHSVREYVRDMASTNGIESFWAMLKRGHQGIYHKMSPKHLDRYVQEFAGRHNVRNADTIDQMSGVVAGMAGKRLRYRELIAGNGLSSGARG